MKDNIDIKLNKAEAIVLKDFLYLITINDIENCKYKDKMKFKPEAINHVCKTLGYLIENKLKEE